jgi:ATP-binding cassette, subfamily B, beta-glucan exporter
MKSVRLFLRLFELIAPEARLGWLLVVGNVALAAAQFTEPVLFGRIVDTLAGGLGRTAAVSWAAVLPLTSAWGGFGLIIIGCGAAVALYADRLSHRRRQAVLTDYFEHVLQLPPGERGGNESCRLIAVMLTGTDALWALWLAFYREHFAAFVSLIVALPLTLLLNWRLGMIVILLAVVFGFLNALVLHKTKSLQAPVARHYADLAERASDALGNVALVQSYARIDAEAGGLRDIATGLLGAQMPVLSWWAIATVLTRTATIVAMLTLVLFGIWLHFRALATVGEIVSFVFIATLAMGRLEQAIRFADGTLTDLPRLRQFFDVLDMMPGVRDRTDAVNPGRAHGLVEFKDVSYSYDGKRPAVADLTFTALPGQTIALVGDTGAGKSTALALMHRDFDPQSGMVTIDGMDIRGMTLSALRGNIGVVSDDTFFFDRTIAENLRIGKPDATDDELRTACVRAQAIDAIDARPEGFEAAAGKRGSQLSAGERQLLSIARAFLKDPPILIIDRATGTLDVASEAKVQAALDELMKGRTAFVIAQRASNVRNAGRILMFEDGRVVENGTFDDLMRLGGKFAAFANAQLMTEPAPSMKET